MELSEAPDLTDKLVGLVRQWIAPKLQLGEGFSVLLVSAHPEGQKATKYQEPSVEIGLARCRHELCTSLADASAYAFAYDARIQMDNALRSVIIFQVEQRGQSQSTRLAEFYDLRPTQHDPAIRQFHSDGTLHRLANEAPWLAPLG